MAVFRESEKLFPCFDDDIEEHGVWLDKSGIITALQGSN
jgi:hypothetical protein